ncbi:SGNH/GDSL hydrolase family protein [Actinoplanes auranticolor]|uniref:SGNH hydrolase-type esterase domain-containing protein n=1 Tax=Actinoplanes auranticolor TaxID=47988 RepID=A0A919SV82_9ACTN|nr:SGNH/GDSL hydrolase family protein [Actinoplanes auranticolor]GIM79500.1 hypothetical protein Aau02nite_86100 [Actinoplanes auranticolor]
MTASTTRLPRLITATVATFGVATLMTGSAVAADRPATWTGTWSTAVTGAATPPMPQTVFENQTLRQIVHTSIAGRSLRVRLSNEYGTEPLVIGEARIARSAGGSQLLPGTDRRLTFGGRSSFSVPPGAPALSDPVTLPVPALSDLVVSIHLPQRTAADHRWPDFLARRLQAQAPLRHLGALNKGIGGNRLLHDGNTVAGTPFSGIGPLFGDSALSRFDRDVLAQPGARAVIVLLGINDIGQPTSLAPPSETVTAEEIINGHRQLIARAHERGLRIIGATLTPFQDTTIAGYYSAENEAKRAAVNRWIRTGGEYDGVIDFDRAVRDPAQPLRLLPRHDSGDHLHPNDAGMQAMADAIPLRLLQLTGDRVVAQ